MNENIKRLALDIYNKKVTTFSNAGEKPVDAEVALRELILNECPDGKWNRRNFHRISNEFFEIIEDILTATTTAATKEIFDEIMVFKDFDLGDRIEFKIPNSDLFDVSLIANGTNNLYRQRLTDNVLRTQKFDLGIKVYEEFDAFIMGKVDFKATIDKVILSFNDAIAKIIAATFAKGYDSIKSQYKVESAMNPDKVVELAEKLGNDVVIYGSKIALSKLPEIKGYDIDSKDIRENGYVKMFRGIKCVELKNGYKEGSDTPMIPNDTLYFIPSGTKVMAGGFEGDAMVYEDTNAFTRQDRQVEFLYTRRFHFGMAIANKFGAYKINA